MAQLCKKSKNPCSLVACPSSKQPHQKSSQQNSDKSGEFFFKDVIFDHENHFVWNNSGSVRSFLLYVSFFCRKKRQKHGRLPMATVDENPASHLFSGFWFSSHRLRAWYIFHLSRVEMRPQKKKQGLIHIYYIISYIYIYTVLDFVC